MRWMLGSAIGLLALQPIFSCSADNTSVPGNTTAGTGATGVHPGTAGAGGNGPGSGGAAGATTGFSGGSTATGGVSPSTAGNMSVAGSVSGGFTSLGGSGSGGDSVTLQGGATSAGTSSGGATSSGGSSSASGGTSSTANCTDTPPPNGDTCANAVKFGWCGVDWMKGACARSCNMCSGGPSPGSGGAPTSSGGRTGTSTGGSGSTVPDPPRIEGGMQGHATRYWDCCKAGCAWKGKTSQTAKSCGVSNNTLSDLDAKNSCEGGPAFMCWSLAPWAVSDTLSYGYAAVPSDSNCGKCYQLQFNGGSTSNGDPGSKTLSTKTMIVQIISNGGDVGGTQFDLLIPGGGVGKFNACSTQWGGSDLGEQYGGFMSKCQMKNQGNLAAQKTCVADMCKATFGSKPDLAAGCDWYLNWFGAADNPTFAYKEVTCPEAIVQRSGQRR